MKHAWRGTAVALAFGLALALAAGGAWGQEGVYRLTIQGHRFSPEVLEVPAGKPFQLVIKNLDATPEEFESNDLKREKVIPGGGEITLRIGALKPGTYEFFGEFNPATAKGRIVAKQAAK